ncbi:MAG: DEAD/DEAH box helicase [Frankiaceae bacterium]|nr:DEAD/DEAH box helicase [Frankiaceae bacterium]MBV9869286.1 DEAD/DEAH box helicase [Frankiaceae bacterium]
MGLNATGTPPPWLFELTDDALRHRFGPGTFERGYVYARQSAVRSVHLSGASGILLAEVDGNRPTPYQTLVRATDNDPSRLFGRCSCPVATDCKHVVAVLLACRDGLPDPDAGRRIPTASTAPQPAWSDVLGDLLTPEVPAPQSALALQFEVVESRYAAYPRLRIRPLTRGKNDWIKTGASWGELERRSYYAGTTSLTPGQRAWVSETLAIARSRLPAYTSYSEPAIHLDDLGPAAWRVLANAVQLGFTLLGTRGRTIELSSSPARPGLDIRRRADGDIELVAALRDANGHPLPADAWLVGDPAHGAVIETDTGLRLLAVEPVLDAAIRRLIERSPISLPESDLPRFLSEFYPAASRKLVVTSGDGSVDLPEIEPPRLALRVRFEPGHRAVIEPSFTYRVGDEVREVPPDAAPDASRDIGAERELLAAADVLDALPGLRQPAAHGPTLAPQLEVNGLDTAELVESVLPALAATETVDVTVDGDPATYGEAPEPPMITLAVRDDSEQTDWFNLAVAVSVGGEDVPFAPLFTAMSLGEDRLLLDSGTWFRLDHPELQRLRELIEEAKSLEDRPGEGLRVTALHAGLWDELVSIGVVTEQSERWSRSAGALLALTELPDPTPPAGLRAELRPYQREGYGWLSLLWDLQLGGVLADDMGLGKTVQTLAMAMRAAENGSLGGESGPLLIVTPTSVMSTWASQAAAFCPSLDVRLIPETVRRSGQPIASLATGADIVVTSFTLFRIDEEAYRSVPWCGLVLDEAQFVKNHQAKTYQCARRLPAPFKLAITGTPLENSLMDLWSMLSITAPGLFPNPKTFNDFYRRPIEAGNAPDRLDSLRRRVRPLMLRRTKEHVAQDLPPKTEQVLDVTLNPQHRRVYDMHLNRERQRVLRLIEDMDRNRISIFKSLTTLRQLSLDASLIDVEHAGKIRSSKIDVLVEQLREVAAEGHRALVFSQFTRFLGLVRDRLTDEGIGTCYLDGRTRDRASRIAAFTEGTDPVFLISLKAGGFGLNLTEADYVYVLDPWWNPAAEEQAIDRTHRIGQTKPVMVYRLVATDTIEEKVVALQQRKRDLFAQVVDGGGAANAPLTADDIRELFAS